MKNLQLKKLGYLFILSWAFLACKEQTSTEKETQSTPEESITKKAQPITLERLENSPSYTDAVLEMNEPKDSQIKESGEIDFSFTVKNYELGAQTDSSNAKLLANSGKGQHIHFILDNQPYSAHYESAFAKAIPDGTHHLVAFLSRSYHESVKNDNSVVVKKLVVGNTTEAATTMDMESPTLIYSRPKGTYTGEDTKNVLLDFFVLNTTLSKAGNSVRATINETTFLIDEWAPMVLKGLPLGQVKIKLELIDENGEVIPGPFNTVNRVIELKE